MFTKNKTEMSNTTNNGSGATLIGAGTTLKGDIKSNNDLRIDGTVIGNINSNAKIIVGTSGVVEGDIMGNQADIVGKVSGNIRAKELLQLRGDSTVTGNIYAGKLQIEPTATFNGQCHMGANVVEISKNEQQAQAIAK
ncbi:MAG: polymer-forming cytoskeletal protein [Chitinophagaceae bacterium]|nr:polymer-forming cytoskeletal protein [Chitinophagaceae bacterium]MBK8310701.1 polymer-forming cytoskeletal protein [Chitinophagaceae bacterium]MBK8607319.1 polymer-forming cytoskeletal protein [Chitinophagaceae bacterium]MBP6478781.1 polymer-forming cytoskeletal protein [Chitinophagaceae bacterium]MBP7109281.1 polymer-forming cytoskeletal protein [Chitinophagaceae bacterium]